MAGKESGGQVGQVVVVEIQPCLGLRGPRTGGWAVPRSRCSRTQSDTSVGPCPRRPPMGVSSGHCWKGGYRPCRSAPGGRPAAIPRPTPRKDRRAYRSARSATVTASQGRSSRNAVPHARRAVADALLDDYRRADAPVSEVRDGGRVERDREGFPGGLDLLVVVERDLDPRPGLVLPGSWPGRRHRRDRRHRRRTYGGRRPSPADSRTS